MRATTPVTLNIHQYEHKPLRDVHVEGGQLTLKEHLMAKFVSREPRHPGWTITLSDAELGEIIRHMGYAKGNGGWQSALRACFWRALCHYCRTQ